MLAATVLLVAGSAWGDAPRWLQWLVLAAELGALWHVGRRLASALLRGAGRLSQATASLACAVAVGSGAATLLGHFGQLRPAAFLSALAALLVVATGALPPPIPWRRVKARPAAPTSSRWDSAERLLGTTTLLLLALAYVDDVVRSWHLLPGRGGDDPHYHLTAVAVWQRFGDLRMVKFPMGDWSTAFYPIVPDLFTWQLVAPFRDSDVLARWSSLPFAIGSLVAVAAVCRRLGISRRSTLVAVLLYGVVPRVPQLALSAGNDHIVAFATLAGLDAALMAGRWPRLGRAAYLGVCLGLLAGAKYIGIYNVATLLVVVVAAAMAARGARWRRLVPALAVAAVVAVTVGGYTYVRNAVTAGNPVFPQPVSLLGLELPGVDWLALSARFGEDEAQVDPWGLLTGRPELLGRLFRWTILPAALLAPWVALVRRRWLIALVLALPAAFFAQFLFLMHDHREVRYFLAALALGAVAAGWLTDRAGRWGPRVRVVTLVLVFARVYKAPKAPGEVAFLLAVLALGAAVLASSEVWRRRRGGWGRWAGVAASAAGVVAAPLLGGAMDEYQKRKLEPHWAARALDSAVGGAGAVVAYASFNQPYLYFGGRLQNEVHIVPRNRDLEAEHYRWGGTARWPYARGNYRAWVANLRRLGVRYVVVSLEFEHGGIERRWMRRQRREFELVHADEIAEVWKLREPVSRSRRPPAHRLGRASSPGASSSLPARAKS